MYEELIKRLRRCASYDPRFVIQDCEDAADAIEELMRRCEQFQYMPPPAWIPATERLPNVGEIVVVYTTKATISRRRVFLDVMITSTKTDIPFWSANNGRVTHWMPLPEPPKEET